MNRALRRAMLKRHGKKVAWLSTGIISYELLLTYVYPVIAKNPAVAQIAESIPSTVKTVFGVSEQARVDTFEAFISAQFYARIWVVFMVLFNVGTANELLAKMIDDGAMAFLLSTPVSREELFSTQASVLGIGNFLLVLATYLGLSYGTYRFDITIDKDRYFGLAVLGFAFFSLIGAYSLFFSARFAGGENALLFSAGLTLAFYALDIVGGLKDTLAWTRNLSIFRWYQPQQVLEGSISPGWSIIGLTATSTALYYWGKKVFKGKDLAI